MSSLFSFDFNQLDFPLFDSWKGTVLNDLFHVALQAAFLIFIHIKSTLYLEASTD